jgi:mono/diheme cytochrome c family protein
MSDAKSPKVLFLLLTLVVAAAVAVAGCGGSSSSSSAESTSSEEAAPPAEEEGAGEEEESGSEEMSEKEARSGTGSLSQEGEEIFTSTCGSCHTLAAAGTSGEVGPNLDELEPDLATVEHQVVNGGGGMPAFGKEGALNAKEIKAVATYVSSVAGQG